MTTEACFSGLRVLYEEPVSQGCLSENGQHNSIFPCLQQGWHPLQLSHSTNIGTLVMVSKKGHNDTSLTRRQQA